MNLLDNQIQQLRLTVGSLNPVKIAAAKHAISPFFPDLVIECHGMHAPSLVPDQPMTNQQTKQGAINRMQYCRAHGPKKAVGVLDLFVAMEGGVDEFEHGAVTFAYVVIGYGEQQMSLGRSCELPLPRAIFKALQQGQELGDVMDSVFNTHNIKQKGGAIGLLTNGQATRESTYTQALTLAMAPLLHPQQYAK
ncbi:inosine/xanthosine triphosphatase [Shewanella waksmanii]|uniref:inosine/xanthosine triphosphatase n=1 Tax=Shewanella waksmanii TaxID=213783 RepID=UPI00048F8CE9|nr:inosine/xanthosine triphosphatase [Shewanella waksmanii]